MSLPDLSIELPELKPEMTESIARPFDYWKSRLTDTPMLELPTDKPRPAVLSFRGESQQFSLPLDLADGLKKLSCHEGVTLHMILVAALQVLLHRYSGQDNIVIGTLVSGPSQLEREGLIGVFVNTLVLHTDLSGNPSFRELLAQVREVALGAYASQDMPVEKLLEGRDLNRNSLFQVMFILHDDTLQLNEVVQEFLKFDAGTTQFDLTFELSEIPHGLAGRVEYAIDLFEVATIDRMIGHFQTLLEGIVAHPDARLFDLPLLTEPERKKLLVEWNDTTVELSDTSFIHQLFEEQVERTPQAVAVVYEGQHLTYAELNARANQLAHYLRHIGVRPEVLVGICLERSLDQVIGFLGILKAGGAYVPLDPGYPKERLAFILEDTDPLVLLTHGRYETLFIGERASVRVIIDLEDTSRPWANQPETNPDHHHVQLSPENLAYVMYTSGSTGTPKGVGIVHHGLQNQIAWYIHESHLSSDDKALVVTSFAYALTQRAIFGPLLAGAQLVLASEPFDSQAIIKLVAKERISMMILTPNGFRALIDASFYGELGGLREVFFAGECLDSYRLIALPEPRPEFVNNYGATECTAAAIYFRVPSDLDRYRNRPLPIGRPIWNTQVYILDTYQQLVPVGVAGEIHIGGVQVGRGYLNRPELTAERFVRDPFALEDDARMFKTGDLARWLSDGTIEYLGRNDLQVKIRGFRVEIGEIEAALRQHPLLCEAVAGMYEPIPGDKRLVAYLVARGAAVPTSLELRDFLKSTLPEFMVPSVFVFLDALPITANGKLDRKSLPEPDHIQLVLNDGYIAPRSQMEKQLAEIWGEVLRINRVGIHDNFFELGGHSLLATQVIVRVGEQLSVEISLTALFEMPTIMELAKHIEKTVARGVHRSIQITPQIRSAYKNNNSWSNSGQ